MLVALLLLSNQRFWRHIAGIGSSIGVDSSPTSGCAEELIDEESTPEAIVLRVG